MKLFSLRYKRSGLFVWAVLMTACLPALAQDKGEKRAQPIHVEVATIAPRPEDVATLDGIMNAFYEVVSGPKGQPRQWARDRTLYIPGVRFVSTSKRNGKVYAAVLEHQAYVDAVNPLIFRTGFYEREIHRQTKSFGNITHIFSTYESRETVDGPVTERGVNSLELFNDGKRWWIASVTWDDERPDNPIPADLLP
jgi:hypothetical protein